MPQKELNLLGKDYLTLTEAAHFCCVSESQFQKYCNTLGSRP